MPHYYCPSCGERAGGTIYRPKTNRHHCPQCGDDIADRQASLYQ